MVCFSCDLAFIPPKKVIQEVWCEFRRKWKKRWKLALLINYDIVINESVKTALKYNDRSLKDMHMAQATDQISLSSCVFAVVLSATRASSLWSPAYRIHPLNVALQGHLPYRTVPALCIWYVYCNTLTYHIFLHLINQMAPDSLPSEL